MMALAFAGGRWFVLRFTRLREIDVHTCGLPPETATSRMTVTLNGEWPTVPSITPLFANADWHEREMMELYGIQVTGHPNPTRLFLDEELDAGILNEAVPLSIMMNGACTTDLWERILNDKERHS